MTTQEATQAIIERRDRARALEERAHARCAERVKLAADRLHDAVAPHMLLADRHPDAALMRAYRAYIRTCQAAWAIWADEITENVDRYLYGEDSPPSYSVVRDGHL